MMDIRQAMKYQMLSIIKGHIIRKKVILQKRYLQVIKNTEGNPKAHVYDAQYHGHLHLVGVQECKAVGCQVPNLYDEKVR